jgi:hypothetical protein
MLRARWIVALGALVSCALSPASALCADPTPAPTVSTAPAAEQFDRVDVVTLMAVVLEELKQYQGSILLETRPASGMPAWDPLVFYAGVGVSRQQPFRPVVWTVAETKSKGYEHALLRAYVMAVMDTGEAGPKFKRAYDAAAGADQALPAAAPDPYRYRHAAAEPFVKELTQTNK